MADLRQGQASDRDVKSASARVAMDDLGGTVSGKLQVLFPAAGGWNFFWTPKEGDHVVINRLPNGSQEGYVLGKVYTANKMPQGGEPNIILIVSDDGKNVVKFDADKGTLDLVVDQTATLKCKNLNIEVIETVNINTKNANIKASENVTVKADQDATIKAGGNITVEASGNAEVKAGGNAKVEATGNADLKGANVTVDASAFLTLKTGDAAALMPNIVPQCPFGFPHGGPSAGIVKLKGG